MKYRYWLLAWFVLAAAIVVYDTKSNNAAEAALVSNCCEASIKHYDFHRRPMCQDCKKFCEIKETK